MSGLGELLEGVSHEVAIKRILHGFEPLKAGLRNDFLLTSFTGLKGCGCKVPQKDLMGLLSDLATTRGDEYDKNELGIGLDSCVIPLRDKGLSLVQTTDFFFPLVDDPYLMGRITCANVLSDLYAMGVHTCDNMLMLLGVCTQLQEDERNIVTSMFMRGFRDAAALAETKIRGGQTVRSPWLLLGGVATSVCTSTELLSVDDAQPGDLLVLTKPIGGQCIVNAFEWLKAKPEKIAELKLDEQRIMKAYQQVCEQMCRLNRHAASLLHTHEAHASTDVTGFGLVGHANNLARHQSRSVRFRIDVFPTIEYAPQISRSMPNGNGFRFFDGLSAETSGGLLVALPPDKADAFCKDLQARDLAPAWIIGCVEEMPSEYQPDQSLGGVEVAQINGDKFPFVTLSPHLEIVEVPFPF